MNKLRLVDLDLSNKKVLVRVDFNVPLSDANGVKTVGDDTRIRAAIPTINSILERGGRPILISHLGRPKGEPDPAFSLSPVASYLAGLLGRTVLFVPDLTGEAARAAAADLEAGEVLLLENTRFDAGEKKNDPELARALASMADVYVNDAFGTAHRAHASTAGVTEFVSQSAMGLLVEKEIRYLAPLLGEPAAPFVGILGGAKVSDKIGIIEQLLGKVDALLIGGAMSYTFLRALGMETGTSLVEEDKLDVARELYDRAEGRIVLPVDHLAADSFSNDASFQAVASIPEGMMGLDIGPKTIEAYRKRLLGARTIVWNGPMGVFEMSNFAGGTLAMAQALADATDGGATSVVGGGDSVAAITQAGFEDRVSHVSTGGGAMLEFLEGKTLPGIAALSDA